MTIDISKLAFKSKLWPQQIAAIEKINEYVTAAKPLYEEDCMIALPTGVGKTGIIATVAHFSKFKRILVISPRLTVNSQNYLKIQGEFFKNIKANKLKLKDVLNAIPASSKMDDSWICVTTIKKLEVLHKALEQNKSLKPSECSFEDLVENIDLLIIDEGHWEPAEVWSHFLRSFECPRILFTATPIRNDYNQFNFDASKNFFYSKSLSSFQNKPNNILKKVTFEKIGPFNNWNGFLKSLEPYVKSIGKTPFKKVLIRCETAVEIKEVCDRLAKYFPDKKVIGIHHRFPEKSKTDKPTLLKHVPTAEAEKIKYDIWVHQFKMTEGFDEPQFGLLVLFSPFNNTRQLVQQVGRILRNPDKVDNARALVLYPSYSNQKDLWDSYTNYDDKNDEGKINTLNTFDTDFSKKIFVEQNLSYLNGRFRRTFNKQTKNERDQFLLPLSCSIRIDEKSRSSITEIKKLIIEKFVGSGREILFQDEEKYSFMIVFLNIRSSPFLRYEHIVEPSVGMIYFKKVGSYWTYYSSLPGLTELLQEETNTSPLDADDLSYLISDSPYSKITNVYLKNSAVSDTQYSSKKLWANNIGNIPESIDDHFHVPSNYWGISVGPNITPPQKTMIRKSPPKEDKARRYLGQKSGRVTQDSRINYTVESFDSWVEGVINIIQTKNAPTEILKRYANEIVAPDDPKPYLVALDLDEHLEELTSATWEYRGKKSSSLNSLFLNDVNNVAFEVTNSSFSIHSSALQSPSVKISWDSSDKKFILSSSGNSFEDLEFSSTTGTANFLDFVNGKQAFKVFCKGDAVPIYIDKKFISPKRKKSLNEFNDPVLGSIITVPEFKKILDEKGDHPKANWISNNKWPDNSLFGVIQSQGNNAKNVKKLFVNLRYLLCDDMDTECADFVAGTDSRISLIHCKSEEPSASGSISKVGATHLYVVISQALKNLKIINHTDPATPPEVNRYGVDDWKSKKKPKASIPRKLKFKDKSTGKTYWDNEVLPDIKSPKIDKYVAIVISNGFSFKAFKTAINDVKHRHHDEAVHSHFLMLSLINSAQQLGIKVELYCNE